MPGRAGRLRIRARLPVVGALVLAACGGDASEPPLGSAATPEELPGRAQPARYRGVLTLEGRPEVVLCEGTSVPVDGPALPDLLELHAVLTPGSEPMEGIFVDVLGQVQDAGGEPWLDALEVRRAAFEGWGCRRDESSAVLRASGTEPFWSLSVEREGATWSTPEAVETLVHDGPYTMTRGGWALEARTASAEPRLQAEFYAQGCQDPMSGAYSHLTVLVTLGDVRYRGCGYFGPELAELP